MLAAATVTQHRVLWRVMTQNLGEGDRSMNDTSGCGASSGRIARCAAREPNEDVVLREFPGSCPKISAMRRDGAATLAHAVDARPGSHLYPVDVVRFLTVGAVIAVHATAFTTSGRSTVAGAALIMLHVSREVFLFISAFVLAYAYRNRGLERRSFWRKRMTLVAIPYAIWTAIYVLSRPPYQGAGPLFAHYVSDLATGHGSYHLYFLVVTLQLYIVFPWLLRWLGACTRPGVIVVCSLMVQLAFTAAGHYAWPHSTALSWAFAHDTSWLPAYQLYIVAGVIAGLHYESIDRWLRSHVRSVIGLAAACYVLALAGFAIDVRLVGMTPRHASEVFQPAVVIETLAILAVMYILGTATASRADAATLRHLESSSDVSFAVYLAHPLLLTGALAALRWAGFLALLGSKPAAVTVAFVAIALVPALYGACALLALIVRRTPLSLALTGRPMRRTRPAREPSSAPVVLPELLPIPREAECA
jgi:membrane-bound acyltransferase YfiQ involved in biofilm formation